MQERPIIVKYFLRYYEDENGKKTQSMDQANKWIDVGHKVVALLTNFEQNDDAETMPLLSISLSSEDKNMVLITEKKEKYYVKKKLPGYRYIEIDHFKVVGEEIPKAHKKDLSYVKNLVKKRKEVNGVYYESRDCKTITSKIVKVYLEDNCFETDTGIKYYLQ